MSDTRMFRRAPSNYREDARHAIRVFLILFTSIFAPVAGAQVAFPYLFINLQSVTVPDHRVGEDPQITVYRIINRDFLGNYTVTIREASTSRVICVSGTPAPIPYEKAAGQTNPIKMPLSQWIWDGAAVRRCEAQGFGVGKFYTNTCQFLASFPLIGRCVRGNVFARGPAK